ncbi:hypothetical protein [Pontibacter mangrovi]|uniref:Uncharacterized protein n=1 Tax=Pontibacter mangrovi TaxID=2589816 RepID=A0A501W7I3_9BACT|nr:hypothetical protein [Pontibacter mangrovi]TPE44044.1 hypothetical protein FJM65_11530 [Pontibacter mangrovi]
MNKILYVCLFVLLSTLTSKGQSSYPKADPITVKVAVVIQDPKIPSKGNKRMHEVLRSPGNRYKWQDPRKLMIDYRDSLNSLSGGVVNYEIVKVYDDNKLFTRLENSTELLGVEEMVKLLSEPDWATLKKENTKFDYNKLIEHYGFCDMRDKGEINEVWVWSFPYGGAWESTFAGENAFWLNSDPVQNTSCKDLLTIMALNYERDMSLALESYGHRFESIMRQVYGRWDHTSKDLNNWEIFTSYDKITPGKAYIGNIHFPPNGLKDYDWKNTAPVKTYADVWFNYPNLTAAEPRVVTCEEWDCSHLGYMSWWYRHIPNFAGINPADGHLNNWWHYVVDYNAAMKQEKRLKQQLNSAR